MLVLLTHFFVETDRSNTHYFSCITMLIGITYGLISFILMHIIVILCFVRTALCPDFTSTCMNDGYITSVNGRCNCICPDGLDPESGCSTILPTVHVCEQKKHLFSST